MEQAAGVLLQHDFAEEADVVIKVRAPENGHQIPEPELEVPRKRYIFYEGWGAGSLSNAKPDAVKTKPHQQEVRLSFRHSILQTQSTYLDARLNRWASKEGISEASTGETAPAELVLEWEDPDACSTALQFMDVSGSGGCERKPLPFTKIEQALAVLKAASFLGCENSVQACCDYLNSAVWQEGTEELVRETVSGLGSLVMGLLQKKLANDSGDNGIAEPIFSSLLSAMVAGSKTARDILEMHAKRKWQGLSQTFVGQALAQKIGEIMDFFSRQMDLAFPSPTDSDVKAFNLQLLALSNLLQLSIPLDNRNDVLAFFTEETIVSKFARFSRESKLIDACGPAAFTFLSSLLALVDQAGSGQERLNVLKAWMLVAASIDAGGQDCEDRNKQFLGLVKATFLKLTEEGQDVCRIEWTSKEHEYRAWREDLIRGTIFSEARNFGCSNDPVRLLKVHFALERDRMGAVVAEFCKSCPHLASPLVEAWLQLHDKPRLLGNPGARRALEHILEVAVNCAYPVSTEFRLQLLEDWFGEIYEFCGVVGEASESLAEMTRKVLLTLALQDQGRAIIAWGAHVSKVRQINEEANENPIDKIISSWYKEFVQRR